jgi:hypothetical protein
VRNLWIALVLAGCATSYRDSYETTPLGNGRYAIDTAGNGFTDRSTVIKYGYMRAAELCPLGFDIIDADKNTRAQDVTFDGGKTYSTVHKSSATLLIQCKSAAPRGWWCTINGDIGACVAAVGDCEAMRTGYNANREPADQLPGCAFQQTVFCAPTGCRPTPASCSLWERHAGRDGRACAVRQ